MLLVSAGKVTFPDSLFQNNLFLVSFGSGNIVGKYWLINDNLTIGLITGQLQAFGAVVHLGCIFMIDIRVFEQAQPEFDFEDPLD